MLEPVDIIEDEVIDGFWEFVGLHFSKEKVVVHSREEVLLETLNKHLPERHQHDVEDVMAAASLEDVRRRSSRRASTRAVAEKGEKRSVHSDLGPLAHQPVHDDPDDTATEHDSLMPRHGLMGLDGKVTFFEQAQHLKDHIHRTHLPQMAAEQLQHVDKMLERSRILYSSSVLMSRLAPYKDLIVPSGPEASVLDSMINLINCLVGPGILSLPLAFAYSGYVLATIFFVIMAIINAFTADLIIKCCVHTRLTTYNELAEKAFGRWMSKGIDFLIIMLSFGDMMAQMIALGDFGCAIVESFDTTCSRPVVVYLLSLFTIFPLCMLRNLNSLRFATFLCLIFMAVFAIGTVALAVISFS